MTMKMIENIVKIKPQMMRFLVFFTFESNFLMRLVSMILRFFFIFLKNDEPLAQMKN